MSPPDGSTLAISQGWEDDIHIRLLSLTRGLDREITLEGWPNVSALDWAPDGKAFYIGSVSAQSHALLYVDANATDSCMRLAVRGMLRSADGVENGNSG